MELPQILDRDDVPEDVKAAIRRALATGDAPCAGGASLYSAALAEAPVGVALISPDGRFLEVNRQACAMAGLSPEQMLALSVEDLAPHHNTEAHRRRRRALVSGEIASLAGVYRHVAPDGAEIWLSVSVSRVEDDGGNLQGILCVLTDVTETTLAARALEADERKYRDLLSHGDDWLWRLNTQGEFTYCSPVSARLTGYEPSELVGRSGDMVLTPESSALTADVWRQRLASQPDLTPFTLDLWHRRKDGSEFLAETRAVPIAGPDGLVTEIQGFTRDVSQRAAMEVALRAGEERYRLIFERSPVGLWVQDFSLIKASIEQLHGRGVTDIRAYLLANPAEIARLASLLRVVEVNEATLEIYGAESMDQLVAALPRVLGDASEDAFTEQLVAIAEGRRSMELEAVNHRLDGAALEVVVKWSVAPGFEETYGRVVLAITDVTQQRAAARALADGERRYRVLVENLTDLVVETDTEGRLLFVSPSYCNTFQKTERELLGTCFFPLVHPDDREAVTWSLQSALQPPYHSQHEERAWTEVGWRWFQWRVTAVADDEGRVGRVVSVGRDITDAKQAELALAQSEERFRSIFENAPVGIFHSGPDLQLLRVNDAMARMFGYGSPDEMLAEVNAKGISEALYWDPARPPEPTDGLGDAEDWRRGEGHYRRRDGRPFVGEVVFRGVPGPDGAPDHLEGFIEDVTEAREAQRRVTTLLDYLPGIVFLKDTQSVYLACNQALSDALGLSKEEIVGKTDYDLYPRELADKYREDDATVLRTGQRLADIEEQSLLDGRVMQFTTTKVPVIGPGGEPVGLIGLSVDLSERRRAEDAQRLSTVGQLAAGVAHEFNNIMAGMMLRAQFAQRRGLLSDYEKLADLVVQGATRGREICRGLSAFAEPYDTAIGPVDMRQVIDSALSLAAGELAAAEVRVVRNLADGHFTVSGDAPQLSQVLLNMVVNACHAMAGGGTLTIGMRRSGGPNELPRLAVTLQDTGSGIAPEHLPHIFDPFFTTKGVMGNNESVPGTGLGLSVAHGILKRHGATVDVESHLGEGTTFTLLFPLCKAPAAPYAQAADTRPRILVADDDPDLRTIITESLVGSGYGVGAAGTATQAVELMAQERFHLVIADLMMPGGGAREVLRAAAAHPYMPVIILTGRVEAHLAAELTALGAAEVLRKPIAIDDLCGAVARVIDAFLHTS